MANMIQKAKQQVTELVTEAYLAAAEKGELPAGLTLNGSVEIPKDTANGDFTTTFALAAAKALGKPPRAIAQALLAHQELLQNSGVEVDDYGGFTVGVRAVPAEVPVDDVGDMVRELANHLLNGGRDALREKTEWVLHSIACRAAIKAGDRTTTDEMLALAQKIMDGSVPPFCPHGRPCVLKLTRKELEKQFGRLV